MEVKGKSVLITGGAGFIGSHLADEALLRGAKRVVLLDNLVNGRMSNIEHLMKRSEIEFIKGDVCDFDLVKKLVANADIILHEAASKLVFSRDRPRLDMETNIIGTFNILEAAKGTDKRIVHASTGSVLGSSISGEMREDHPHNPTTPYGISKGSAERYCQFYYREFGVRVTILRYFHVFGPRQPHDGEAGVVSIFIGKVLQGQPPLIFGNGEQVRCFTYVLDDVAANFLMLAHDETIGHIYNCASRTRMPIKKLAEMACAKYGPAIQLVYGGSRPGEMLRPIPDTSKIEALGFRESVTFEQGLEKTHEWVKGVLNAGSAK